MEPSRDGLVSGEGRGLAGEPHEDILGDFLGETRVTDLPIGGGEDQTHMPTD
jgi:hypothetical protein